MVDWAMSFNFLKAKVDSFTLSFSLPRRIRGYLVRATLLPGHSVLNHGFSLSSLCSIVRAAGNGK